MPIFEYKCGRCGQVTEILQQSPKIAKPRCPKCGSDTMAKQFSVFSPKITEGQSKRCHGCTDNQCPHAGR